MTKKSTKISFVLVLFSLLLIGYISVLEIFAKNDPISNKFIIAVSREADSISIIDAETMQILERIKVGDGPHEVISSPDGKTAYVANYGKQTPGNSISVIDVINRKEIKRIDLGDLKRPHGLVERNGKIYFTAEASEKVGRYNPQTDKVDWVSNTEQKISHMLEVSKDEKKIYTANIVSNSVTVIENEGASPKISQISVGIEPEGISLSPNGKTLWIGHRKNGLVSIIDTATNQVKETLIAGKLPLRLSYTPDGKQVYIANPPEGSIIIYDAETRKEIKRIPINGAPIGMVFSKDGKKLYVTDLKFSKVIAVDTTSYTILGEVKIDQLSDGIGIVEVK